VPETGWLVLQIGVRKLEEGGRWGLDECRYETGWYLRILWEDIGKMLGKCGEMLV
jgi:hypothetical protein